MEDVVRHQEIRKKLVKAIPVMLRSKMPKKPRLYQREMFGSMVRWLRNLKGSRRAYVSQATGLGKTFQFNALIKACVTVKLNALVIVPSNLLRTQSVRSLAEHITARIGHLGALKNINNEDDEVISVRGMDGRDVVIATDEGFKRNFQKIKDQHDPKVIIWDECHWGYTEKAQQALDAFPETVIVGFSATPDYLTNVARADYSPVTLDNGEVLYGSEDRFARTHFGECLDERSVRWGIQSGYLAPLAWGRISFDVSLEDIGIHEGPGGMDYDETELRKVLSNNWGAMTDVIRKLYRSGQYGIADRSAVAICSTVEQAESLADVMTKDGIPSACITGRTSEGERDDILEAYVAGKIKLITSVFVLREGWDMPRAEVCMMLRPTKSRVLYVQFMGRVLRIDEDNPNKVALVLDPLFQDAKFSPLSAPILFGEPGTEIGDGDLLLGPRGGRKTKKVISPYTFKSLNPKLVIEQIETEFWADAGGFISLKGEIWGMAPALARRIGLSIPTVRSRCANLSRTHAKDSRGQKATFYRLQDVEIACADLLEDVPRAGTDGTFERDGEVWGTLHKLAAIMGLSDPTVLERSRGLHPVKGKAQSGALFDFYALKEVREVCKDLLGDIPISDVNGTVTQQGEIWATMKVLAELLGVSESWLKKCSLQARSIRGKDRTLVVRSFYAVADVRKIVTGLDMANLRAGKDGTLTFDGDTWGTPGALHSRLGLGASTVERRCRGLAGMKARDYHNRAHIFYRLKDVEQACRDLLDLPRADADGILSIGKQELRTAKAIARTLAFIPSKRIYEGVQSLKPVVAKSSNGRVDDFYVVAEVQRVCAMYLRELPKLGDDGILVQSGVNWIAIQAAADHYGLGKATVLRRMKRYATIQAIHPSGATVMLYKVLDIEKEFRDLIGVPKVDKDGLVQVDGETWGGIKALAERAGATEFVAKKKLKSLKHRTKEGRDRNGKLQTLFLLSDAYRIRES